MRARCTSAVGLLVIAAALPSAAATVTLCQSDVQTGPDATGAPGVNLATAVAQGGSVAFSCGPSATIRITKRHFIDADTQIQGLGVIKLDAEDRFRMFWVRTPGVTLALSGLVLDRGRDRPPPGGRSVGGGVAAGVAGTTIAITSCRITRSRSPINSFGAVVIEDSSLSDNTGTAVRARDLSLLRSQVYRTAGAGIRAADGSVVLEDSELTTNRSSVFEGCDLTMTRTRFAANQGERGGAFYTSCRTTIESGVLENNQASLHGGAVYADFQGTDEMVVTGTRFEGNTAGQLGGAIALGPGWPTEVLRLRHVTFTGNKASSGGALHLGAWPSTVGLEGTAVLFAENTAVSDGGAIWGTNTSLTLRRAIFAENRAGGSGGALSVEDHVTPAGPTGTRARLLGNALLVRNQAAQGSALHGSGAEIVNSTIADNQGPALVMAGPAPAAPIRLTNTLLSSNAGGNCASPGSGAFVDRGHNLQFPGSECGGSIPTAAPAFDEFYAPWLGSPALDAGDDAVCASPAVGGRDVYGHRRPHRGHCTIGAVETDVEDLVKRRARRRSAP